MKEPDESREKEKSEEEKQKEEIKDLLKELSLLDKELSEIKTSLSNKLEIFSGSREKEEETPLWLIDILIGLSVVMFIVGIVLLYFYG